MTHFEKRQNPKRTVKAQTTKEEPKPSRERQLREEASVGVAFRCLLLDPAFALSQQLAAALEGGQRAQIRPRIAKAGYDVRLQGRFRKNGEKVSRSTIWVESIERAATPPPFRPVATAAVRPTASYNFRRLLV